MGLESGSGRGYMLTSVGDHDGGSRPMTSTASGAPEPAHKSGGGGVGKTTVLR